MTGIYGVHAHIDEALARLVAACWYIGIATNDSCQGGLPDQPEAYIGFAPGSGETFIRLATLASTPAELEAQPREALDWRIGQTAPEEQDGWWWSAGYPWIPGFAAHFPPSDIPELTRRLERFG